MENISYLPIPEEDFKYVVFKIKRPSSEDHLNLWDSLSLLETQVATHKT